MRSHMIIFGDDQLLTYWDIAPREGMGANILGAPHFDEGLRGYISLNIVSGYKLKNNLSSICHGHGASILDPTIVYL